MRRSARREATIDTMTKATGSMARGSTAAAAVVLVAVWIAPAAAHEFWLEPSSFGGHPGDRLEVRVLVGDGFPGEPYPRNPDHLRTFALADGSGRRDLHGRPGDEPAGRTNLGPAGTAVVWYAGGPSVTELDGATFDTYIEQAGLDGVLAARAAAGTTGQPVRERFSRCAKTVIRAGGDPSGFDRVAGMTLELVPLGDPLSLEPGDPLPVRVLFDGEPAGGVLVRSFRSGLQGSAQAVRSGENGQATVVPDAAGLWMLSAVVMRQSASRGADWDSFWSSLTFPVSVPSE